MKKYLLIIIALPLFLSFSQTKYLIYFKDKGITETESIEKTSLQYKTALSYLSDKSIERRIKNMGKENFITFEDLPIYEEYVNELELLNIKIQNKLKWFNAVSAYLTAEQLQLVEKIDFVNKTERVKVLIFSSPPAVNEQVFKNNSTSSLNDYGPSFGQLQLSDVPAVHSKGITGEGILIGLLDTGFDWKNHESLVNTNVVAEYDFVFKDSTTANDTNDVAAQHNHGTLVLSIIAGLKDSSLIGAAFGSDFILAKTEDIRSETHVEEDNYAAALEWMEGYGVDVTSSSLGYSIFDPSTFSYTYSDMDGKTTIVTRAAELSYGRGIVTITSAGNEGNSSWFYITAPADGINTLGIGAVNNNNEVVSFSSRGPSFDGRIKPDVVAQGLNVYGALAGNFNGYGSASGTSVSAPIASGIAALLLSAHPHLLNSQVRNILFETADNSKTPDYEIGYGLLSALNAVQFPNLQETQGTFTLHKMILQPDNIDSQSVAFHYSTDGENYADGPMEFDLNHGYKLKLPFFFDGDLINFFFTYKDFNGTSFRDPVNDTYKFFYGQLNINLNLDRERTFTDFIISEPYPNPFIPSQQTFTRISVKSSGNESLKIKIIDPIGQEVETYSTITQEGTNHYDWYGKTSWGIDAASGAYYFLVDLNGRKYSRNLILLR
ncbi:MAG: S8 family serine peptidase [Ignavibacteriaceae bacterium]